MLKKILMVFGIIFLVLAGLIALFKYYPEPDVVVPKLNDIAELDSFVEKVVKDNGLPSMAVAVLDSTRVRHISAFGLRNKWGTTPVTTADIYHLGSNTKAITGVLVGMYIDDGLLDWETTIVDALPNLSTNIHTRFHDVTIHELLTHTSGVPANFNLFSDYSEFEMHQSRLEHIKESLKKDSHHKRSEFLYSNLGYVIVGTMLEQLTGKTWEELVEERIFTPLQMESAGFGVPGSLGKEDQPWGHKRISALLDFIPVQFDNVAAMGPGATVHTNTEDWAKFLSFQLFSRDTSMLSSSQRDKLLAPIKDDYACGWLVPSTDLEELVYTHSGSNTLNYSNSWLIPEKNIGVLININAASNNMSQIIKEVRREILSVITSQ